MRTRERKRLDNTRRDGQCGEGVKRLERKSGEREGGRGAKGSKFE